MIADMHCDTLYKIREKRQAGEKVSLQDGNGLRINLKKLRAGGYTVQNFAAFIDMGEGKDPYEDAMELVTLFEEEMKINAAWIRPVTNVQEIKENRQDGRLSALLTLEEGGMCRGEIGILEEFYRHGARMMTFCWNYENELASPAVPILRKDADAFSSGEKEGKGLKKKGFEMLEAMEALGMIPDVSHLSDEGFYDVCRAAKKPFVASHSNARALCGHGRNLTDDMLRQIGERGGVAGLNFCPEFLSDGPIPEMELTLKLLADHALHMMHCAGSESVGLGSDFDGFDLPCSPAGADRIGDLAWALHRAGLTERQTEAVLGGNVLRLYREILR